MSLCRVLEWDSRHFGRRVARLEPESLTEVELDTQLRWCDDHEIDCLCCLVECSKLEWINLLARNGFMVPDIRVVLQKALMPGNPAAAIELADPKDGERIAELTEQVIGLSRFYADPNFDKTKVRQMFGIWARNTVQRGSAVIHRLNENIGGYVGCQVNQADGIIELVAVSPDCQGRGVGKIAVEKACLWLASQGCSRASVATQAANLSALHLYEKCGFQIRTISVWFHKWFERANRQAT